MNLLNEALRLANDGFHILPLIPNSKLPWLEDFPNKASTNPEVIKSWWVRQPNSNIGISTSRFNGSGALVVVDVDNKGNIIGDNELFKLELDGYDFPETLTQETPTGGRHLIYYADQPVKQGVKVLGPGLDIRSKGGYIVASGSVIDGKKYLIKNPIEIAEAPQWIIDKCGVAHEKKEVKAPINVDEDQARIRALHYLEEEAPTADEGERNHKAYVVACRIKDLGVSSTVCAELIIDHWDGCNPPLEEAEIVAVVDSAYKNGINPIGISSPEAMFDSIVSGEPTKGSYLDDINKEYALLFENGGHSILHEKIGKNGLKEVSYYPESTFKRIYSTKTVQLGNGKAANQANLWLDWPGRREYQGLCFSPEKEPPKGYYNLWGGFTCEPLAYGDADLFQKAGFDSFIHHAKENVCLGDEKLFQWLMGYFAHMIQKPYERPLTTLVFQGRKGTGKNALVDRVGNLLGSRHYLVAHDGRYLTSNFNGHMDSCLCLVLDEAFWSGDKAAEGKLKGITTSPTIMIERKGKEAYLVDNLVRLIVIGNEEWLVPASADERRYAVFQVGEGNMQDNDFFTNMRVNLDELGGNRVLLHYLKTFDIKSVRINIAPKTKGLANQKVESLGLLGKWWHQCLVEGFISNDFGGEWSLEIDKATLRQSYSQYCKSRQIGSRLEDDQKIGTLLKKYCPEIGTEGRRRDGTTRVRTYKMPTLEVARQRWCEHLDQEIEWSDL